MAQAIGQAAIQQGYRVLYRETHKLLDDLAEATIDATRKECMELFVSVPLLIIDDLGMRKLPMTAAEDLLEIIMRRYERASTLLTSNRPVDDWANFSAIAPPLPPCSIAYFIMATCLNAVHGVGAQKQTCLLRRRRSKTT
jgi:DNA replication protein DnaC